MFNIGTPEMVLIAFIALVVVGPQRLPSLFRQIGRGLAQFRQIQDDVKDMVKLDQYIDLKDPEGDFIKPQAPKPTPHTSRVSPADDLPDLSGGADQVSPNGSEEPDHAGDAVGYTPTPEFDDDEPPLSAP
ncbi:MAG: sec-independent protein translocase protein TatA [Actinomycetota bacterium]|jgi:Tat protein translocase TatB subunit|nr:sec-independent protein translocase protein TatA [Actinomycetota bacterium]MEA2557930.1 sec-independent protein translocase protein TatA [Actinomycetota bacterium]